MRVDSGTSKLHWPHSAVKRIWTGYSLDYSRKSKTDWTKTIILGPCLVIDILQDPPFFVNKVYEYTGCVFNIGIFCWNLNIVLTKFLLITYLSLSSILEVIS